MLPGVQGTIESIVHGLLFGGDGGVKVKSVQRGFASVYSGAYTGVTISPVNLSKSFAIVTTRMYDPPNSTSKDSPSAAVIMAELVSSNTLRLSRGASYDSTYGDYSIAWQVVELDGNVNVQQVVASFSAIPHAVTISPVDPSKTFVVSSWKTTMTGNRMRDMGLTMPNVHLANQNTLEFRTANPPYATVTVCAYVVEVKG